MRFFRLFNALLHCAVAVVMAGFVVYHTTARAEDGDLDTTFGTLGRLSFPFPSSGADYVFASGELSDGRLVIAGSCGSTTCIARLRSNGTFDPTFGSQGFGYIRFSQLVGAPTDDVQGFAMAVLPDGRMAVVGAIDGDFGRLLIFIVRADGTGLDTSKGGSGTVGFAFGSYSVYGCCRIFAQADGTLLATASIDDFPMGVITAVSHVLTNNSLDQKFGTQGVATVAFNIQGPAGGNNDFPTALAVQTDGKILVGVNGQLANGAHGLEFARLLTNGQRDMTFGPNGDGRFLLSDTSHSMWVNSIAVDSRQRLVFGGYWENGIDPNGSDFEVMVGRLTDSGVLDTSFNGTGTYVFRPLETSGSAQYAQSVAVTSDSIIVASQVPRTAGDQYTYFAVTRLNTNGSPSTAFGGLGTRFSSFITNSISDMPVSALVTKQGIVVSGDTWTDTGQIVGVARLQYQHIFADSFQ